MTPPQPPRGQNLTKDYKLESQLVKALRSEEIRKFCLQNMRKFHCFKLKFIDLFLQIDKVDLLSFLSQLSSNSFLSTKCVGQL